MTTIAITRTDGSTYHVTVTEGASRTEHDVTVTAADLSHYAPGRTAEQLLVASFEFLLEQEAKESILPRFAVPIIERYFPQYPHAIREKL